MSEENETVNTCGGVSSADEIEHANVVFPPESVRERAHIQSMDQYREMYRRSIEDPEAFWREVALENVSWFHPFDRCFSGDFGQGDVRWFSNGKLNVSYNCLDRHVEKNPDKIAIIWEGDEIDEGTTLTFAQLFSKVCKLANALKRAGVKKGDSVAIYMPMVPESAVAMLACTRIGAMHSVVFAGFSSQALKDRIIDGKTRFVITTNQGVRGGRSIPLKKTVDEAIQGLDVQKVFVSKRKDVPTPMQEGRDVWLDDAMAEERPFCPAEWMDSEDPLFVLYTSGSTGKPKGLIHTHGGYLVYASLTHKYVFDYHPNDVFACAADVGWITGHSYIIYGPLCNGATTLMFEGLPTYPSPSRYWQMIERHKITAFYTAPTAIRALMKFGDDPVTPYNLSSLRVLGSVGEPINPEAWKWYNQIVGKGKASIVDTYWQTETGGHMLTPLPGATPTKPGSATFPFFGVKPIVLDPQTGQPATPNEHGLRAGVLCIEGPWPSMARTVSGDHERFLKTYFSDYKGLYFTGDGATVDADGYFWITGRVDDVINKAGHRLGTAEIESALVSNAACAEAAVIAIADDVKGQAIIAFCALREGFEDNLQTENALRLEVRKQIGPIATPDHIVIVSQLPKTRSGKIMRRLLRKIAQHETKDLGDISTLADESVVQQLIEKVAQWSSLSSSLHASQ